MCRCVLLAFMCLSGVDFSAKATNLNSEWPSPSLLRGAETFEGSGGGHLRYSDDEDFGDGESGSGSGSGFGSDADIIIDGEDTVTKAPKRPSLPKTKPTTTLRPLTECEKQRKNVKTMNIRCLANGDFDSLQCDREPGTSACWCADLDGKVIPGTEQEAPSFPDCDEGEYMSPCFFQLVKHTRGNLFGSFRPRCAVDGGYLKQQCHVGLCFCVNETTGLKIAGTEVSTPQEPECDDDDTEDVTSSPVKPDDTEDKIDIDDEVIIKPGDRDDHEESMDLDISGGQDSDNDDDDDKSFEETNETGMKTDREGPKKSKVEEASQIWTEPGILAGIIGGSVIVFICLVLLVMFIIYRMRKKDEGSYPLDEPSRKPNYSYVRAPEREFYA